MNTQARQSRHRHRRLARHRRGHCRAACGRRLHGRDQLRRQHASDAEALAAQDRAGRRPRPHRAGRRQRSGRRRAHVRRGGDGVRRRRRAGEQCRHHAPGAAGGEQRRAVRQPGRRQPQGHASTPCARRRGACATAAASSTCRRASSACMQPTYAVYAATKAGSRGDDAHPCRRNCAAATSLSMRWRPDRPRRPCSSTASRRRSSTASTKLAPLERLGQPEDIAATVAFLAGPDGALDQRPDAARQRRNRSSTPNIAMKRIVP